MDALTFSLRASFGAARSGTVTTARGEFLTPCFMPVGTRGTVRTLTSADLETAGFQVVLANTYHLMLKPGAELIHRLGGLHGFGSWAGHVLTDSGGYQVFSLSPAVDDEGVTFRSTYDGSTHHLSPEEAVRVQALLGSDIQMVLDVCTALPATPPVLEEAARRTLLWAKRARETPPGDGQAVFGIVQGGVDPDLRYRCALDVAGVGFDGYGIGGLSVGEPRHEMLPALDAALAGLPVDRPRYLMGVGDPIGLVEAIARGVDMFDCVLPTRLGRHGTALTSTGRMALRPAAMADDPRPIDEGCSCPVCARWSRAFIRHLLVVGEPTASRLVSVHNLHFMASLMAEARDAIAAGTLDAVRRRIADTWEPPAGVHGRREPPR